MSPGAVEATSGVDGRILDEGSTYDAEETMEIGGVERTFKTVKFPLIDEQDQITAVCGISIDITAQKEAIQLRDELTAAQQQAIDELRLSRQETVERLAKAIGLHDSSTGQHVDRMAAIASFLGVNSSSIPTASTYCVSRLPCTTWGRSAPWLRFSASPGPYQRRARGDGAPHRDRPRNPRRLRERAVAHGRHDRPHPSRALRRQRLSAGAGWRGDSTRGPDHGSRRCFRRIAQRPLLSARTIAGRGGCGDQGGARNPIRPTDRRIFSSTTSRRHSPFVADMLRISIFAE